MLLYFLFMDGIAPFHEIQRQAGTKLTKEIVLNQIESGGLPQLSDKLKQQLPPVATIIEKCLALDIG
jgi:hypothetical protein